jgi:hypothetical protein
MRKVCCETAYLDGLPTIKLSSDKAHSNDEEPHGGVATRQGKNHEKRVGLKSGPCSAKNEFEEMPLPPQAQ